MPLGIGIISFAHGHVTNYAQYIKEREDANVLVGWDEDPERGKSKAEAVGAAFAESLDDVLGRSDIQAVIIGSETSKHAEHVEAAAKAGKDILLQKPMAFSIKDCERIQKAVKESGVRFSLAWQMRCDPQNIWMRDKVRSGDLGKIVMVRRRHGLGTHLWGDWFVNSWHVSRQLNFGMFMDDASHAADWLLWMFGKPKTVTAEIDTLLDPKVPDDNGVALYRFEGGTIGILESSFTLVAADETTNINGENGVIIQRWGDGPSCSTPPPPKDAKGLRYFMRGEKDWNTVDLPTPSSHGMRISQVAEPALAFLKGERDAIATAEEGRTVTEMILAAYASAKEGRRVVV